MSSQLAWSDFPMEDRIRFITHRGKQILLVDPSGNFVELFQVAG